MHYHNESGLQHLPVTVPEPPVTAADSVTRLVLARAISALPRTKGQPIVVSGRSDDLTGRALPESPEVPIILPSPVKVQELADEYGDFGYLEISPVEISADPAKLGISHTVAVNRSRGAVFIPATVWYWVATRVQERWFVERPKQCLVVN
jgi:hypothetical protein